MGGQVTVAGATLAAGPAMVTDNPFPSGTTSIPFALNPDPKPYNADSGRMTATINSSAAYVPLGGLGSSGGEASQAHTVYFRCQTPMLLRETYQNPAGGTLQALHQVSGLFVKEYPANALLTLLEVQGSGQVEWYFAANV